jgi:uncharacterized RDD family membrane protein YckC
MNWFYVENGKSVGPIGDDQFRQLFQTGKVGPDTLIWREGMAEWKPAREAGPGAPAPAFSPVSTLNAVAPEGHKFCAQCGNSFPQDEMMKYENLFVCVNCKPLFLQKLKEGVRVSSGAAYGGFWIRLGAKIIDGIILMILYMVIVMPLTVGLSVLAGRGNSVNPGLTIALALIPYVINLGINIAFSTFFIGKFGATPGKMACGLKVISPDGSKMTYMKAFLRYLGEMVSGLTLSIGYLIAAWDEEKRTLHDRICNTRVVRA